MNAAERARAAFELAFGIAPAGLFRAPGRVNLIGEHTDYNDGFVLPCAIDRDTVVAVGPSPDGMMHVIAADLAQRDSFRPALPIARGAAWANYGRGVAVELIEAGWVLPPLRLVIAGDVPLGAGLSSSAALEIATLLAMTDGGLEPVNAARLGQRAENRFVGCACGIMDQLVSATALAGHALLIDCQTLERRAVPLPADLTIVVIDSGIRHAHASGDYNIRRVECARGAAHYRVAALRDLDEATLVADTAGLDDVAYARARHVVTENARVLAAADALAAGDLRTLGALMAASHVSMRDDFAITVPGVDCIVALADEVIGGAGGARMTGGGFGGSVVALVAADHASEVGAHVARRYVTPDGTPPTVTTFVAGDGAGPITSDGKDR